MLIDNSFVQQYKTLAKKEYIVFRSIYIFFYSLTLVLLRKYCNVLHNALSKENIWCIAQFYKNFQSIMSLANVYPRKKIVIRYSSAYATMLILFQKRVYPTNKIPQGK